MTDKTLCLDCLCPDAAYMALEVIRRMGWTYDEPNEDGYIIINMPIDDEPLFEFLDNCMMC